jgi:hypothetical protein
MFAAISAVSFRIQPVKKFAGFIKPSGVKLCDEKYCVLQ